MCRYPFFLSLASRVGCVKESPCCRCPTISTRIVTFRQQAYRRRVCRASWGGSGYLHRSGPLRFVLSPRHKSGWCLNFEMGFESPTSRMERLDGLTPKCPALKRIFESYAIFGALKRCPHERGGSLRAAPASEHESDASSRAPRPPRNGMATPLKSGRRLATPRSPQLS